MKFPREKEEPPLLPNALRKALPWLISADTWLCFNTARRSCDSVLNGPWSLPPEAAASFPALAGLPCLQCPLLLLGPAGLQDPRMDRELEAQRERIPSDPSKTCLAFFSFGLGKKCQLSTSPSSIWLSRGSPQREHASSG